MKKASRLMEWGGYEETLVTWASAIRASEEAENTEQNSGIRPVDLHSSGVSGCDGAEATKVADGGGLAKPGDVR